MLYKYDLGAIDNEFDCFMQILILILFIELEVVFFFINYNEF